MSGKKGIGSDPVGHLAILAGVPERLQGLHQAILQSVGPGKTILDAGCGGLGILALLAAKAGADLATGVDLGPIELAQQLARENRLESRTRFIQLDLNDLEDLGGRRFDVLVAMIYGNEPRRDFKQQLLAVKLRDRFLKPGGVCIPDCVRYSVWPVESKDLKRNNIHVHLRLEEVKMVETKLGLTLSKLKEVLRGHPAFNRAGTLLGPFDPSTFRKLSEPVQFAEINYSRDRASMLNYPGAVQFEQLGRGTVTHLVWQQELSFDGCALLTSESMTDILSPVDVAPGPSLTVELGERWFEENIARVALNDDD